MKAFIQSASENVNKALYRAFTVQKYDIVDEFEEADVIVCSLDNPDDAVDKCEEIAQYNMDGERKVFVCISTPATWCKTEVPMPEEPAPRGSDDEAEEEEVPEEEEDEEDALPKPDGFLRETDFLDRAAHPMYHAHLAAERRIARKLRDGLPGFIVVPGVVYGLGEDVLHPLFRQAWSNGAVCLPTPSDKILPMIHATDLANTIVTALVTPPLGQYLFAVDPVCPTLHDIVHAIVGRLGAESSTRDEPVAECLVDGLPVDLTFNVPMKPTHASTLTFPRVCPDGFVKGINIAADEYLHARGLTPLNIMVHGPPGIGKSTLAAALAERYAIPHVTVPAVLEAVSHMEGAIGEQTLAFMEQKKRIPGDQLAVIVRHFLLSSPGMVERGCVLDGYPKTEAEARLLWMTPHNIVSLDATEQKEHEEMLAEQAEEEAEDDEDDEEEEAGEPAIMLFAEPAAKSARTINAVPAPTVAIQLVDPTDISKQRVLAIPKKTAAGTHNTEKDHARRMSQFTDNCGPAKGGDPVGPFLVATELGAVHHTIDPTGKAQDDVTAVAVSIIGPEHVFGPSEAEIEEAAQRERDEAAEFTAREAAEAEAEQAALEKELEETRLLNAARRDRIVEAECAELETLAGPLMTYLEGEVMGVVLDGLVDVAKTRPENPVRALGEYLFRHAPRDDAFSDSEM